MAIVFVVIYLGAAALTLHNRSIEKSDVLLKYESVVPAKAESRLAMVELFLPMIVLLTLAISYVIVKKRRARQIVALEESEDEIDQSEYWMLSPDQEKIANSEKNVTDSDL